MSFTKFLQDDPLLTRAEYMRVFIGVANELELDEKAACVLAAMCCMQEAGHNDNDPPKERRIWCPANHAEPSSFNFPHDSESDDGRSVGICQQQTGPNGELWWGTVADEMNPRTAIRNFMSRLPKGFHANDAWAANNFVQRVQRSGVPDAYAQWWGDAIRLYNEVKTGAVPTVPPPPLGNLPKDSVPDGPWNGDPVWLPEVLRAEGVNVVEYPGWRDRGHGDMGNLWGVVCHHTGSNNTPPSEIADGFPHLRGPLSQIHLARDGTATVIAAGVCWHAGTGAYPGLGRHNGNLRCIGIEAQNAGKDWPREQYDAYVRICAAFCRQIQVDAGHVISHQEYDDGDPPTDEGKWDPGGIDMGRFRHDVQIQIDTRATPPLLFEPVVPYGLPTGSNSGGDGGGGVKFPDWVYQLGNHFGMKPSTYPGHQESDRNEAGFAPNPQHLNRGIDWVGSVDNMQRFADYLMSIRTVLEQVIWQNPNTGQRAGVAGGKDVTNTGYYEGNYSGHRNHVHTRQSRSIPLPGATPPPMQGEDMAQVPQAQWDRVYRELTQLLPSRSRLRWLDDRQPDGVDTLAGMLLNTDGNAHVLFVKELASLGHPQSIALLNHLAGGDPAQYPDRAEDIELAQAILAELAAEPQPTVARAAVMMSAPETKIVEKIVYVDVPALPAMVEDHAPLAETNGAEVDMSMGQIIGRVYDDLQKLRLADALPIEDRAPLAALIAVLSTKNGSDLGGK